MASHNIHVHDDIEKHHHDLDSSASVTCNLRAEMKPGTILQDIKLESDMVLRRPENDSRSSMTAKETAPDGIRAPSSCESTENETDLPSLRRILTITNPSMSFSRELLLVFVVCNSQLMTQATLGQAQAPLRIIGASFGDLSAGQLSWFIAAFSLTVGTFVLAAGRLGDIYGHKLLFLIGWILLALWSLIAGFTAYTHSQIFFDICRSMQGLACAILLPNAIAILGTTYPPGVRKAWAFSLFGATAPNGFLVGGVFSSLVAQFAWWPWAFWLLAIYSTLLCVLAWFVVPSPNEVDDSGSSIHGPQSFDWLGCATGVGGLVLFNVAWNQAPSVGWASAQVIVLLVLGLVLFGLFIFIERRVAQPLVPMDGLGGKVALVLVCLMFGWSSFGTWLYYWVQFSQVIEGATPLLTVAELAPCGVAGIAAATLVAFTITKVKSSWIMLGAMLAFCLGNILYATNQPGRLYWKQPFWSAICTPFGMDMSFPAATLLLSNAAPKRHQGMMASLVTTVVNYSIAFGLGIAGTVEVHVNDNGRDLLKGYRGAWYAGIGLSGLGVLCATCFVLSDYLEEWRQTRKASYRDQEKQEG